MDKDAGPEPDTTPAHDLVWLEVHAVTLQLLMDAPHGNENLAQYRAIYRVEGEIVVAKLMILEGAAPVMQVVYGRHIGQTPAGLALDGHEMAAWLSLGMVDPTTVKWNRIHESKSKLAVVRGTLPTIQAN